MSQGLFSALSGLTTTQANIDVISDNIANMSTVGFKSSAVNFQNVFAKTLAEGSAPTTNLGGMNPEQIGLGTAISNITRDFSDGSIQTTGRNTDMSIGGNGFFTLQDGNNNLVLSRAGNFSTDLQGNLVNPEGYKVLGTDNTLSTTASNVPVRIPPSLKFITSGNSSIGAKKLSSLNDAQISDGTFTISATLAGATTSTQGSFTIGTSAPVNSTLIGASTSTVSVQNVVDAINNWAQSDPGGSPPGLGLTSNLATVNPDGTISISYDSSNISNLSFGATSDTSDFLSATKLASSSPTVSGTGTTYNSGVLDYTTTISPADLSSSTFSLSTFSVGQDGSIQATYANGDKVSVTGTPDRSLIYTTASGVQITGTDITVNSGALAPGELQMQLANVINPNGLIIEGGNSFTIGNNAGQPTFSAGSSNGFGTINSGSLESSNVDMSTQFGQLTLAQSAINANSKTFQAENEVLRTIVGLIQ